MNYDVTSQEKLEFLKNQQGIVEYKVYDVESAEDLIQFGINNNSRECIELGEKML